ncbi:MAG: amidohydrolase family protein [Candidatus Sifarchaeia archaeon]|jgi:predicted TIM-barrel fold metal-dependent hydrolase
MSNESLEVASELSYVDAHCHIGHDLDGTRQTAEMLLEKMDQCGIDHAVIFPFNEQSQEHSFKRANMLIAEIMKKHSERFTGLCRLDPHDPLAISELKSYVNELGLRGIKLHPRAQSIELDEPYMVPIFELAENYDIPILIHTSGVVKGVDPVKLVDIANNFSVNFILGHSYKAYYDIYSSDQDASSHAFGEILELARQQRNLYFETSFLPVAYLDELIDKVGASQVIFGSDSPYGNPCWEKLTIEALNIPKSEKIQICSSNTLRLIK